MEFFMAPLRVLGLLLVLQAALAFAAFPASPNLIDKLSHFEIIHPVLLHSNGSPRVLAVGEHPSRTSFKEGDSVRNHAEELHVQVEAMNTRLVLELRRTADLLADGFTVFTWGDDGLQKSTEPIEHCYYQGTVRDHPESWVAGSTCSGLELAVHHEGQIWSVEPLERRRHEMKVVPASRTAPAEGSLGAHVVYRREDIQLADEDHEVCGVESHKHDHAHSLQALSSLRHHQQQQPATGDVLTDASHFTTQAVARNVELLLILDNSMYRKKGSSTTTAQAYAITLANYINANYGRANLGITVTMVANLIFTTTEPSVLYTSPTDTINNYLNRLTTFQQQYNGLFTASLASCKSGSTGCMDLSHDDALLLTADDRSGTVNGLGWVSSMCTSRACAVIEDNRYNIVLNTGITLSHEMGHNLGCQHDGTGNTCATGVNIMAAGICSNCQPDAAKQSWSTCSVNYMSNFLQARDTSPSNCLANTPRTPVGGAVCGDGIVTAGEQCDDGAKNGPQPARCSKTCTINPAVAQCTAGVCCDTSTGKFRAQGTVCSAALHECDLPDYCSGTSADCGTDLYKPDGTACNEAGPNSKCYKGACTGLDGQCKESFSTYSGNWVATGASVGLPGNCSIEWCSILRCTNTYWDNFCTSYYCASGNTCQVGSVTMHGPFLYNYCNCMAVPNQPTPQYVRDGTPCGPDPKADNICLNRQCVPRPAQPKTAGSKCEGDIQCNNGTCVSGGICACDPGFGGDFCETALVCEADKCAMLNRYACVADGICGTCLPSYHTNDTDAVNTLCELFIVAPVLIGGSDTGHGPTSNAFDGDIYTHWIAPFSVDDPPFIYTDFGTTFRLNKYSISSANTNPAMDPKNWTVSGSMDLVTWVDIASESEIYFDERHETQVFYVDPSAPSFSAYRLLITDIRDWQFQGVGSLPEANYTQIIVNNNPLFDVPNDTMVDPVGDYQPLMQLAELQWFAAAQLDNGDININGDVDESSSTAEGQNPDESAAVANVCTSSVSLMLTFLAVVVLRSRMGLF